MNDPIIQVAPVITMTIGFYVGWACKRNKVRHIVFGCLLGAGVIVGIITYILMGE